MAEVNINEIIVQDRIRQNNGWLDSLERSIEQVGVLQPIGITPDKHLIFGGRRLQACKNLGLKTIPVRIFDIAADDPIAALRMEREENEHRMDLSVSEKIEIAKRIEEVLGNRRGQRTDLQPPQNIGEVNSPKDKESSAIAAKAVDMNRETYRQAKTVVDSGQQNIIQAMDSGVKSINAAYREVKKQEPPPQSQPTPTIKPPEALKTKMQSLTFTITLCRNPEDDADALLSKGGSEYCTKLAMALLKAAGHNVEITQ